MKISSYISGFDSFSRALNDIADDRILTELLSHAANDIRTAAQKRLTDSPSAVETTGKLARSLQITKTSQHEVIISTPLDYGWHLEFGTRNQPAKPWLEPALDEMSGNILHQVRAWLSRAGV